MFRFPLAYFLVSGTATSIDKESSEKPLAVVKTAKEAIARLRAATMAAVFFKR